MNQSSSYRAAALMALAVTLQACASSSAGSTTTPRPDSAPPSATPAVSPAADSQPTARRGYTDADVQFVQHMLAHHAQALVMTDLLPTRTARDDMRLLAQRIDVSQQDEMATMRRWLERRGEPLPDVAAHQEHAAHQPMMPGMLTEAELARLAAATGAEFDRLFLEYMIRHHEGAVTMVATLFATPGAGQETELFSLAADIDADQRAEIDRMRRVLQALDA